MIKVKRPFGYYDTALGIIGRTGENDTRTIDFDCTAALEEYSNANIICVCLRPGDDEPYTIPLSTDGDHRILTLASADLEKEGRMTLELRMVDGDKVLKSARFTGTIASSLQGEGDAPGTPVRDTLDRLDAEIKAAQAVVDDIRAKLDAGDFNGPQGPKGDPGSDASVTAENIQSALGYAPVKDVQVAGSSVLVDGVGNIKISSSLGVDRNGIYVPNTTNGMIVGRMSNKALTANAIDNIVKAAMCDGKGAAWTAAEQKAARDRMGVEKAYELIEEITLEEDVFFERYNEPDGTEYDFREVELRAEFPACEKTGNLAVTYWINSYVNTLTSYFMGPFSATNAKYGYSRIWNENGYYRTGWWTCVANNGIAAAYYENPMNQGRYSTADGNIACVRIGTSVPAGTKITIKAVRT